MMNLVLVLLGSIFMVPLTLIGAWLFIALAPIAMVLTLPAFGFALLYALIVREESGAETLQPDQVESTLKNASRKFKILVVDDDESSVAPLMAVLENQGAEVEYVTSGREMTESFSKSIYDLIFLDSSMPEMSGEDALVSVDSCMSTEARQPVVFYSNKKDIVLPTKLRHFYIRGFWNKMDIGNLSSKVQGTFEKLQESAQQQISA